MAIRRIQSLSRGMLGLLLIAHGTLAHAGGPSVVRVVGAGGGWSLSRDGSPYFIKGAGGGGSPKALAEAGANSVRTWGVDDAQKVLDEAHANGLTVTLGVWLGHRRHGFDYDDAGQVAAQAEAVRKAVLRFKDHPALLMWGLGNEMEGYGKGDDAAVWSAVNSVAAMVHKIDPNHPTMTVVAEIGGDRVTNLHRLCPEIDVVGINAYGGGATIPARYKAAGGLKPFVLAEFGPPGMWEAGKTSWGAPIEKTSTEKALDYASVYRKAIAPRGLCLGSYAFLWGTKQEATATWFGLLLPDGSRLAGVDALQEMWTGRPPAEPCPAIDPIAIDGPREVAPGATIRASIRVAQPGPSAPAIRWSLAREPGTYGTGGDAEPAPEMVPAGEGASVSVTLPRAGGGYRLFAFVSDGRGRSAAANVPLLVKGPSSATKARLAEIPLVIYDEGDRKSPPYSPSGYMGNARAIAMDPSCAEAPHSGKTCLKVTFSAPKDWGGVAWQDPADDWGDLPGGLALSSAKTLSFWAKGSEGGEVVTFSLGLLGPDKPFPDTASAKLDKLVLTPRWTRYSLDLKGLDLSRIKTPFSWVLASDSKPVVFYLDDVKFE